VWIRIADTELTSTNFVGATSVKFCSIDFHRVFSERERRSLYVVVRPSVVCLSVCNVRAPYSNRLCFYAIGYLGHLLTSR